MLVTIPTTADPFYTQITALDGVDYRLRFCYNQREDVWYISIATSEDVDLASGIKLVVGWPILLGFANENLPPGTLMVISNTTDDSPPRLADLQPNARCELVYLEEGTTL